MSENVRSRILDFVRRFPAVHPREVERQLGLSDRLAAYHLEALERDGFVLSFESHGYRRFMASDVRATQADRERIATLRQEPAYRIILKLLRDGEQSQGDLAHALDVARASLSYHLRRLERVGLVEARVERPRRFYRVASPADTQSLLERSPPLPHEVDRYSRLWHQLMPRHAAEPPQRRKR